MKAAVMQPYLFPYIGYFQLIASVDTFVLYDDVNYIKKGWINRNNILVNGQAHLFSIPLKDASQNKLINQIEIGGNAGWQSDLIRTIELSYKKAPYFSDVFPMISEILLQDEMNLARFIAFSLQKICNYLSIPTQIMVSSQIRKDNGLKGQGKILAICKALGANEYVNAIGGKELYDRDSFSAAGIALHFVQSKPIIYAQFKNEFIPWLSIIDVMMFNGVPEITALLDQKELV